MNKPHTIEFYDPYGEKPDVGGQKNSPQHSELYPEEVNTLLKLMKDTGKSVHYNNHQHQSKDKHIATCGRHSLMRILYENLDVDAYNRKITSLVRRFRLNSPDQLVVKMFH